MLKIEDLKEGTVLVNPRNEIIVQGNIGDIMFAVCAGVVRIYSIQELNTCDYTIKPEVKHYLGFPIGDYTGKNIIVSVSDESLDMCNCNRIAILIEVKKDCIVAKNGNMWIYAKLVECDNHNLKLINE